MKRYVPLLLTIIAALTSIQSNLQASEPIRIGSKRQLFVDRHLIDKLQDARLVLHHPVRREIVFGNERPWEKYGVSYLTAFRDGDRFRAWYRVDGRDFNKGKRGAMAAYAESKDGIHWTKPNLGLIEFDGSKENNIVWDGPGKNISVFKDGNPTAPDDERYKAIIRNRGIVGLVSPDGLRWRQVDEKPLLTEGPFDSHNIVFWDAVDKQYVIYTRGVRVEGQPGYGVTKQFKGGVRWIRRSTSTDFRSWTPLEPITTGEAPLEQFYTNSAIRYPRAPQYLFMFPSRFVDAREPQPGWIGGKGINDVVLLTSRDGINFDRTFLDAFVRPGPDQRNWHERALFMERAILQTSPTELSLYSMQNWRTDSVHIQRLTLRTDGFVSVHGPYRGGELITRPMAFSGSRLELNYATSAAGSVRVELQDASGKPLSGFALEDCPEIFGDRIDGAVTWNGSVNLKKISGTPVRLRFVLRDADIYSFRFLD